MESPSKEDEVGQVEKRSSGSESEQERDEANAAVVRKAFLKIDFLVIPIAVFFYFVSLLDRTNIGNASVAGLRSDLSLSNHQYSAALTITYVPYMLSEVPVNWTTRRIGAHITLPTITVVWGIIVVCQGAVKSYSGLLAARVFLGLAQGGALPGILYYLQSFYRSDQLQLRIALMFSITTLINSFSGLLAGAIQGLDGRLGHRGWSWIFYIEGAFTAIVAFLVMFIMPRGPSHVRILTTEERRAVKESLLTDRSFHHHKSEEKFSWGVALAAFKEPVLYSFILMNFFAGTLLYGLGLFTPTIINTLGFSSRRSQILSTPPVSVATVGAAISSYFSDRFRVRGLVNCLGACIALSGFLLYFETPRVGADYVALFLQTTGAYMLNPSVWAWISNSFEPKYKKATALAASSMGTQIGGMMSVWLYSQPPRYKTAQKVNMACCGGIMLVSIVNMVFFYYENKRRARKLAVMPVGDDGEIGEKERYELGNKDLRFRYSL